MPTKTKKKKKAKKPTVSTLEKEINKRWGEGTMMRASDPSLQITRIPCGILSIDWRLGGGFARGRHFEMYGNWSVGKTYVALALIAAAQRMGIKCAFVDAEATFDPVFAASIGVNNKKLVFHKQKHGQQCIDFMETLIRSGEYGVVVLDSIAALLPKEELESDIEASSMGTQQAKLMSKALRKLTAANSNTVIVFINQTREAIGVVFGKRDITSGGKALGFYAGTRLELVRTENIKIKAPVIDHKTSEEKEGNVIVGHRVLVRVEKDKTGGAKQHDETTFVFDYRLGGIDPIEDLIYVGRRVGVVHKKGPKAGKWWIDGYEDEEQTGRNRFKKWLRTNVAVQEDLTEMIEQARTNDGRTEEDNGEDAGEG